MKKMVIIVVLCALSISLKIYADTAQMNMTLTKIINQLQALKPLITQAERQQLKNSRYQIHFNTWCDSHGQIHQGLRQDINTIQASLIIAMNRTQVTPRAVQPIRGDFI